MGLIWGREYQLMDLPDFCFAGVGIFVALVIFYVSIR
jgi:hypothetical protein